MPTKLGQNFLKDASIADKIVRTADLNPDNFVIEVGPGKGILTERLADRTKRVVAVEVDMVLSNMLLNNLSSKKNVDIIREDILKINLNKLATDYNLKDKKYKVVANLPYYITSPVIRMFLEAKFPPKEMILMVQKEVAERMIAKPGKMSILAVSVQYYARPELIFYVKRDSFEPVPEVDSAVIKISLNLNKKTSAAEVRKFFRVVRAGFSAKRKILANNISSSFHLDKKIVEEKIKKAGLNPVSRAQELSIEDWKKLSSCFSQQKLT